MTKILIGFLTILCLVFPVSAEEITAPEVPQSGYALMPECTDSFVAAFRELMQNGIKLIQPEWAHAAAICKKIIAITFFFSLLSILSEKITTVTSIGGTAAIACVIFQQTGTLIEDASGTVREICEYGKLLCPVMTTALAAQGGVTASAALYAGSTAFLSVLGMLISGWMIPLTYIFLVFSIGHCAFGEVTLKKMADAIKGILQWILKTLVIAFTTYMSISGVIGGSTDLAALKTAKLAMSTAVPVVGGILSDASESVVVSMGIIKNTAGIYGILATAAVFLGPFLRVGVQCLFLKATAMICGLFSVKNLAGLIDDFSAAMGLLLAMVAASCTLVLISTICFMKGIG